MKKTIDGGATFTLQTTGVQNFLLDIYFLNSQKGFACGESGLLLKTIDGGTTWTSTYLSSSNALYSIAFRDSLHGYISGDSQLLYATSDGGTTWKYLNNSFTMRAITFRSPYIGYAVGPNDTKLYFDPIKTLNGYTRACKGTSTSFVPKLVSGINILPGNNFIMEMDTTGNDFNDALFLGAYPDTSSSSYWYFNIPATLKAGVYSVRVRATATTPVYKSMITNMTVYDDAEASIAVRNDTLFANYNPKYLYQWRLGFTNIVGANNYYYVPTAGGNYTLEVQYGCCNYAEASVNITSCATGILVAPQTSGTFVLGCDSSAFTLKATDAVGYRWYDSDTSTVILSTNSTYTTPVLTVRDTFYVAAFNGTCESSRVPIVTDFASKPSAPTVLGDSVCEGNEAFLFTPGNNYSHWFTDSLSTIDLQTSASFQIHSLINTDTFYVSNFNYQCESKRTPVIAYAVEKPVTTSILGDTTVAIGDTATYFYTPSAGNSFQWITVGGTIISQNDSLILKWDSIAIGKVGIVESNMLGCKSDTLWLAVTVDFGLVIRQLGKNQIGVSPNPASNKIVLERTNSTKTETILVYDSNGKMVIKTIITAGKNQVVIDTSKLSAGTYYIMSNDNIQVQEGKFVIVR